MRESNAANREGSSTHEPVPRQESTPRQQPAARSAAASRVAGWPARTASAAAVRPNPWHIDSRSSLAQLRHTLWLPFAISPATRIVLSPSTFRSATATLQARVNRLHRACGCAVAAAAVMGCFAMQMAWWIAGGQGMSVGAVLRGIGALVAVAVLGKLAGILGNRLCLSLLLRRLDRCLARQARRAMRFPQPTES